MQTQFVYAEHEQARGARKAMRGLVEASVEPTEIDVVAVHDGRADVYVPIVHQQPVMGGALCGVVLGLAAGLGLAEYSGALRGEPASAWPYLFPLAVLGAVGGAIAGLLWWRVKLDLRARGVADADRFIIGTAVSPARVEELASVLRRSEPSLVAQYPIDSEELARRRANRKVMTRL
jgi:hypothetical protein